MKLLVVDLFVDFHLELTVAQLDVSLVEFGKVNDVDERVGVANSLRRHVSLVPIRIGLLRRVHWLDQRGPLALLVL